MATVRNIAGRAVDLSDGRVIAPGETAEDVDTDHAHQRQLVTDELIAVEDGMTPRKRAGVRRTVDQAHRDSEAAEQTEDDAR